MNLLRILLLVFLALILVACGRASAFDATPTSVLFRPTATPSPEPNADLQATQVAAEAVAGEALFVTNYSEVGFSCANCHAVEGETVLVGPSLAGIAERAAERVEGQDAHDYIYQSIVNPNDYVVDGFNENLMPGTYADLFSDEELEQIIQYLLNL